MFAAALLALGLTAAPPDAAATSPELSRFSLSAGPWAGSSVALSPGLLIGVGLEGRRTFGDGPFFLSARLAWGTQTERNADWVLEHQQPTLGAGLGVALHDGAGTLWAQVGGGGAFIVETALHQGSDRVVKAAGAKRSWTLAPELLAEAGLGIDVWGGWGALVAGGPWLHLAKVNEATAVAWGGFLRLGVFRAF